MVIRITKKVPGCVYGPGTILDLPNKKANYIVRMGLATRDVNDSSPAPFNRMKICRCGFIGEHDCLDI